MTTHLKESVPVKKTIATLAVGALAGAALAATALTASDNSAQEAAHYASTVAACNAGGTR